MKFYLDNKIYSHVIWSTYFVFCWISSNQIRTLGATIRRCIQVYVIVRDIIISLTNITRLKPPPSPTPHPNIFYGCGRDRLFRLKLGYIPRALTHYASVMSSVLFIAACVWQWGRKWSVLSSLKLGLKLLYSKLMNMKLCMYVHEDFPLLS